MIKVFAYGFIQSELDGLFDIENEKLSTDEKSKKQQEKFINKLILGNNIDEEKVVGIYIKDLSVIDVKRSLYRGEYKKIFIYYKG